MIVALPPAAFIVRVAVPELHEFETVTPTAPPLTDKSRLADVTVKTSPTSTPTTMLPVFTTNDAAREPATIVRLMSGDERSIVVSALYVKVDATAPLTRTTLALREMREASTARTPLLPINSLCRIGSWVR